MAQTPPPPKRSDKYTAVIFVHGMGPQARHANLGHLLEALEEHCEEPQFGILRNFRSATLPLLTETAEDAPFMQFDRFEQRRHPNAPEGRWRFQGRYRAFEAYWSPVTAKGASPWKVAAWAVARLTKPADIAKRSWREVTRLRIARLHLLRSQATTPDDPVAARGQRYVHASLLAFLHRFRGAEGKRFEDRSDLPAMDAKAFMYFATKRLQSEWYGRIDEAIKAWDKIRLPIETLTLALSHHLKAIGLTGGAFILALLLRALVTGGADWSAWLSLAIVALLIATRAKAARDFLARTFSDVYIWNNNQDHDSEYARRREVLAATQALIETVVGDPQCKRVVIVAHSLGTAITLDTLSQMGQRNVARAGTDAIVPLSKISHLFTLGSPIDKIFYFFQTRTAAFYRAGRLDDDLRGNLSQEPFFRNGRPGLRWLNIWDRVDIVSDPLFTPLGNRTDGASILSATIENHQVQNTRGFDPWESHVGYLDNDEVVQSLAAALFHNHVQAPHIQWPTRLSAKERESALNRLLSSLPFAFGAAVPLTVFLGGWAGILVAALPPAAYLCELAWLRRPPPEDQRRSVPLRS